MLTETTILAQAFILGFTIGISAALVPGPMMLATVSISFRKGWKTGLYVFGGHSIVETAIVLLIIMGAASFIVDDMLPGIAIIGGLAMTLFGLMIIRKAKDILTMDIAASTNKLDIAGGPFSAGIFTSALNPTFLFWWLTAGSAIIMQEYLAGVLAVLAFIIGHWLADLGFLVTVSSTFSRGKQLLSRRTHQRLLYICGSFLTLIGFFFIVSHNNVAAMI